MKRYELSAIQWRKIEGFLPGRPGHVGVTAKDNRVFVNGVLWVMRSGARWKDMPAEYGNWKSAHKRFTRWAKAGLWERIFEVLLDDPKNTWVMIDSTIVRAHQLAASGKRGARDQALGRSRGGLTTKIHVAVDAAGQPVRFILSGGEASDFTQALPLLRGINATGVIADKGYDSNEVLEFIRAQGAEAVIPPKSTRCCPPGNNKMNEPEVGTSTNVNAAERRTPTTRWAADPDVVSITQGVGFANATAFGAPTDPGGPTAEAPDRPTVIAEPATPFASAKARASALMDPSALKLLRRMSERRYFPVSDLAKEVERPEQWLLLATLVRADYVEIIGDAVRITEAGRSDLSKVLSIKPR